MSAMAWAASGIASISHWMRTTALTMTVGSYSLGPFQGDGHPHAPADAQRGQPQRVALLPHLVRARQNDPCPGHPDGMPQRDGSAVRVQPVVVELQLAVAREDLRGEGLVQLDDL